MPTIEFRTFNKESYANTRPVAAREMQPEWWKKQKVRVDHRGRMAQTIRSCPSMQDWLTMGYYILATEDINVMNGPDWNWPCLLYTSPSPRDRTRSRMPSSA